MDIGYEINDLENDLITGKNGTAFNEPISAAVYVAQSVNSLWIMPSWYGYATLCESVPDGTDPYLSMVKADQTTYDAPCGIFFGGRPTHKPK